ncbi:MAG TPA: TonB-dependent receptor [Candidatus Omnitrophota bacterium]|nr:TonB-dependent receptor [Candidatus Omnitrophota bacterium]
MKRSLGALFSLLFVLTGNGHAALSVDLDTIVVSASRLEQEQYEVAGNVTVIPKERIEASGAQSISDVLYSVLGVFIYEAGTNKARTIDIRGFGDTAGRNVLVLVNGRKINNVDVSGPDLTQVPLGSVERIEVIRGGASVLYGDNAVAGVINIITKEGEGDLSGKLGATYGSYSRKGEDLELSGSQKGISYYLYSQYLDDRGYRDNSDMLTRNFNSRMGYEPNDHVSFDVTFGQHRDNVELPGGLNASELETFGRKSTATPNDYADTKDQFVQVTTQLTPWLESDYLGDIVFDFYYRDREVFDIVNTEDSGSFTTNRDIITRAYTGKYIFDREILDRKVDFVVGFDLQDAKNDIYSTSMFSTEDLTIKKEELGIFGYLQVEAFENFYINAGKRHHRAEYTFDNRSAGTFEEQDPEVTVAMGGMKYEYAPGSNVHFNFQQTFRFLATEEWFSAFTGLNTNIDEQAGKQYELGIKHNFDQKIISSLTGYMIDIKSEIFFDPTAGFFGENTNYGETRRLGIETEHRVDILEFFDVGFLDQFETFVNYTYQDPEFVDGAFDGRDIPMAPNNQFSHGFILGFLEHYNLSLNGRYIGSTFAINDTLNETPKAESYYVVDGKVAFRSKNIEVFAAVNNIFNNRYNTLVIKSQSSDTQDFYPAPKKNYNFGVNLKF